MKSLKKTTFLEAIAAAIDHEKKRFHFFEKAVDSLKPGQVKDLFHQMALDGDANIKFIQDIYKQAEGKELPNLKQLNAIEKFHSSTIQKMMDKLDRNKAVEIGTNEKKALELAIREGEDARNFYNKIRNKFSDPKINLLFQKLSHFNDSNTSLIEAQAMAMEQAVTTDQVFFWEDESLLAEVNAHSKSSAPKSKAPSKKTSSKSSPKKSPAKKKAK